MACFLLTSSIKKGKQGGYKVLGLFRDRRGARRPQPEQFRFLDLPGQKMGGLDETWKVFAATDYERRCGDRSEDRAEVCRGQSLAGQGISFSRSLLEAFSDVSDCRPLCRDEGRRKPDLQQMVDHHADATLPRRRCALAPDGLHLAGVAGRCVDQNKFGDEFGIARRELLRDETAERNAADMRFFERLRANDFR